MNTISTCSHQLAQKSYEVMILILAKHAITDLPAWHDLDMSIKQRMILAHQQYASIYMVELPGRDRLLHLHLNAPRSN